MNVQRTELCVVKKLRLHMVNMCCSRQCLFGKLSILSHMTSSRRLWLGDYFRFGINIRSCNILGGRMNQDVTIVIRPASMDVLCISFTIYTKVKTNKQLLYDYVNSVNKINYKYSSVNLILNLANFFSNWKQFYVFTLLLDFKQQKKLIEARGGCWHGISRVYTLSNILYSHLM